MTSSTNPVENTPETRRAALCSIYPEYVDAAGRAVLHVYPDGHDEEHPFRMANSFEPDECNAIGSARHSWVDNALRPHSGGLDRLREAQHFPILQVKGLVGHFSTSDVSRLTLMPDSRDRGSRAKYSSSNLARPIFQSLGVEFEVFQGLGSESTIMSGEVYSQRIESVALTFPIARNPERVLVQNFTSPADGENYLYLNATSGLEWDDYIELLAGMVELGVVDLAWAERTKEQNMAIVPVPWS